MVAGLLAVALVIVLSSFFVRDTSARLIDQAAFLGAARGRSQLEPVTEFILGIVSVPFLLVATVVIILVGLARRHWGDAARAAALLAGANLTTQLLKATIERPVDAGIPDSSYGNSLPSGHTTVAASVVLAAILVAPRGARPVVGLIGAGYAMATGVATMSLGWHRPSDAVVAFAVVAAWSLLLLVPNAGRTVPTAEIEVGGRRPILVVLGLLAVGGLLVGGIALAVAFGTAAGDVSYGSDVFTPTAMLAEFLGSAAGVVGAAAATVWSLLVARR